MSGCLAGPNGAGSTPEPDPTAAPTAVPTASPSSSQTPTPTPTTTLDSTLAGLLRADNRTAYAERHGIALDDGRVRVLVGLRDGATLPADVDLTVALRDESEVLASVAVSDLSALSRHENVTVVRVPDRPYPADGDGSLGTGSLRSPPVQSAAPLPDL